ncbi:MAG: transposase, partial [Actinomycetota bacterium]|nr:transposase [Actinomycetota bacterium]
QHRPMVERSLAWITRGNRRPALPRHRGTAKNHAWLHLRVSAINLRRLLTLGLLRTDSGWALAS